MDESNQIICQRVQAMATSASQLATRVDELHLMYIQVLLQLTPQYRALVKLSLLHSSPSWVLIRTAPPEDSWTPPLVTFPERQLPNR